MSEDRVLSHGNLFTLTSHDSVIQQVAHSNRLGHEFGRTLRPVRRGPGDSLRSTDRNNGRNLSGAGARGCYGREIYIQTTQVERTAAPTLVLPTLRETVSR